jgi:hypothetical protein
VKQRDPIRASVYGRADDILLLCEPSTVGTTELKLAHIAKNQLAHWGNFEWENGHTTARCEKNAEAVVGMIHSIRLFANVVAAEYLHRGQSDFAELEHFLATGKATYEWGFLEPQEIPASWN